MQGDGSLKVPLFKGDSAEIPEQTRNLTTVPYLASQD
jgi:hypothetical protein